MRWLSLPGPQDVVRLEVQARPAVAPDEDGGAEWRLERHRLRVPGTTAYRARLVDGSGSVLSRVLLLVPSPDPMDDPLDFETNAVEDARDAEERAIRAKVQDAEDSRPPSSLDPLLFCARKAVFFRPRCPRTGARLEECRDDSILDQAGVRRYAESRRRFLFSPRVAAVEPEHIELVTDFTGETEMGRVISADELVSRYGGLIDRCETIRRSEPRIAEDMDEEFACLRCDEKDECYRDRSADAVAYLARRRVRLFVARRWTPRFEPEPDLRYDEAVRWLAGWPADHSVRYSRFRSGDPPPVPEALVELGSSPASRGAAYVLGRKLSLFESLVEQVRVVHERAARPVLALRPEWLAVDVRSREPAVLGARLITLAAGPCSAASVPEADVPAAWLDPDFLPPEIMGDAARETVVASLRLDRIDEIPSREAGFPYVRLEMSAADAALELDDAVARDRFHVTFGDGAPPGLEGFSSLFHPDRRDGGSVVLVSVERKVNPEQARALAASRGRTIAGCFVRTERACEVSVDLYPLGILLLWTVVGGEEVGPEAVAALAREAREEFREGSFPEGFADDPKTAIRAFCAERGAAWAFDPRHVLFRGFGVRPDDVPPDVMDDLATLAFRMWTLVPGFSVCEARADLNAADPGGFAREVLGALSAIRRRVEGLGEVPGPEAAEIQDWLRHWCDAERWKARPARRKA